MITVKRGDTHPVPFLVAADGAPVDLTDADVRLLAKPEPSGETFELDTEVTDAEAGQITHTLTGDLEVGGYRLEVEVTKDDQITTYPNNGYTRLQVVADL